MGVLSDIGNLIGQDIKNIKETLVNKLDKSGGTVSGDLDVSGNIKSNNKDVMTGEKTISTSEPSGGEDGDIWFQV